MGAGDGEAFRDWQEGAGEAEQDHGREEGAFGGAPAERDLVAGRAVRLFFVEDEEPDGEEGDRGGEGKLEACVGFRDEREQQAGKCAARGES